MSASMGKSGKFMRRGRLVLWAIPGAALGLGLWLTSALPCHAQNGGGGDTGSMTHGVHNIPSNPNDALNMPIGDPLFQERRLRQLALATHKSMVSDTDKLLELVTELSSEISTTNPEAYTPEQLRKIAQIEKLAHSVKEKMGNTLQGVPDNIQMRPDQPLYHH
jgi:hypothetical protein